MYIIEASPPVSAINAEPMTAEEIDAAPNSARIWATIQVIKAHHEDLVSEIEHDAEGDIKKAKEESASEAISDFLSEIARAIRILEDVSDEI